jgi:hypothetical protein
VVPNKGENKMENKETTVEKTENSEAAPKETPAEVVAREDHERALNDLHKFKKQAKENEEKLKQFELAKLKESENYKAISEIKDKELTEYKEKYETLSNHLVFNKKYDAVKTVAIKAGLLDVNDLEGLDFSAIAIETTSTGNVNVLGVDSFVTNLKNKKPHWFDQKKTKVNSDSPEARMKENTPITVDDVYNL